MQHKELEHQYYKLTEANAEMMLVMESMSDFCRFARNNSIKSIFTLHDSAGLIERFAFAHKGGIMCVAAAGWQRLEEFRKAEERGFVLAHEWKHAQELQLQTRDEYVLAMASKDTDKETVEKMKNQGFLSSYSRFRELCEDNDAFKPLAHFSNAAQLAEHAWAKGFDSYDRFASATRKGYVDNTTYTIAESHGYRNAADYHEALEKNFLDPVALEFARERGIRNAEDLARYTELTISHEKDCAHDERLLIIILTKLKQGKEVTPDKLWNSVLQQQDTYRYKDNGDLPAWFKKGMHNAKQVQEFLITNDYPKEYGVWDEKKKVFVIRKLSERKIVIDGSNVAHNSKGDKQSVPTVQNMIDLVKALKKKGFERVKVISDASLKHKLSDKEKLDTLKELCEYGEAPAERPADIFIINYVKIHHCLLVSNDQYAEWKHLDSWIEDNIDFYRLRFNIAHGQVLLPDLEEV
ncbi:MAG: NYN domain-containing protein [Flavobacteriales bacterium]